jgi:putative tricarboxylic transport membrane protein
MQGITPGPELFTKGQFWVNCIMGGLLFINVFMLVQGTFFIKAFANVTKVPFSVMVPCVLMLCALGSFAVVNSSFDVFLMMAFGIAGYLLKKIDYPIPPLAIALVLGQLTENNLRRSLILSQGNLFIFLARPISLLFLVISMLSVVYPFIKNKLQSGRRGAAG